MTVVEKTAPPSHRQPSCFAHTVASAASSAFSCASQERDGGAHAQGGSRRTVGHMLLGTVRPHIRVSPVLIGWGPGRARD